MTTPTNAPFCAVCDRDHTDDPTLVLATWQGQLICTDCLETRPGKEEAEAEARGESPTPDDLTSQHEYRSDCWGTCPHCHGVDCFLSDFHVEDNSAYQEKSCAACQAKWIDVYRLAGYVRQDGVHESEDWDALRYVDAVDTAQPKEPV